jgi:hypothetical protein
VKALAKNGTIAWNMAHSVVRQQQRIVHEASKIKNRTTTGSGNRVMRQGDSLEFCRNNRTARGR